MPEILTQAHRSLEERIEAAQEKNNSIIEANPKGVADTLTKLE